MGNDLTKEEIVVVQQVARGFNDGYWLSKYKPEIMELLAESVGKIGKPESIYLQSAIDGHKEWQREFKEMHREYLEAEKEGKKVKEQGINKDKDFDKER